MHRLFLITVFILCSSLSAFAQYVPQNPQDVTETKAYKKAKTTFISGVSVASVGAAVWLSGSMICIVEQNRYINKQGNPKTFEERARLSQEAKRQPGYKSGQIMEIVGFVSTIAGTGAALWGKKKMKKLKNSSGKTVATIGCSTTASGVGLALNF